jgi:hypothetical protein
MREADEDRHSTASIFGTADGGDALDANVDRLSGLSPMDDRLVDIPHGALVIEISRMR